MTGRPSTSTGATPRRVGLLALIVFGAALLAVVCQASAAWAVPKTYYLVGVTPNQTLPGGLSTNSGANVTVSGTSYGRTLLGAAGTGTARIWQYNQAFTGTLLMGWAIEPTAFSRSTTIAASATGTFGLRNNSGGTWRFELIEMDEAGVIATATLGTATATQATSGTNAASVPVTFNNAAKVVAGGHRVGVRVYLTNPTGTSHRLNFNGSGTTQSSRIVVDETPVPPDPPTTSFWTSPPSPDGDSNWFKSPLTIALTASDPGGLGVTTYYDWNVNPPASLYLGSFPASSGQNTLYYRSTNANNDAEGVRSQLFKVDTSVLSPTLTSPTGSLANPTPVADTVNLRATGSDPTSGVNYMAFYSFRWNGTGYDAVGAQLGANQTVPIGTDTYGLAWNTLLETDGKYMLQAQVRDVAGNTSFSPARYVLVDNSAPVATLATPAAGASIRGTAQTVTGTVADGNLTSWKLEIGPVGLETSSTLATGAAPVANGTLAILNTTTFSNGTYELRLTATDAAGNTTIDSHAPVTLDNSAPSVTSAQAGNATRVDVFFSEQVASGSIAQGLFTVPGLTVSDAVLQPDGRTIRLTTSAQTPGTSYTLDVSTTAPTISDLAGNALGTPNSATFRGYDLAADATPPAVPAGLRALSGNGQNRLSWNAGAEADLDGYNVYRDTSAVGAFSTKVNANPVRATVTSDTSYGAAGVYHYRVSSVDVAGNESAKSPAVAADMVDIKESVGPAGATLTSSTGRVRIVIPAGAAATSEPMEIMEKAKPTDTAALTFASVGYDFQPSSRSFSENVAITIAYDPAPGIDERALKLAYSEAGGPWTQVEGGSTVDTSTRTVTGRAAHFSQFAVVMTDVTPPAVASVTPATGATGVPVTSFVTIMFSEPMDPATLNDANLRLKIGGTGVPAQAVVYESDPRTAYLYPKQMLKLSTAYAVAVSGSGVKDVAGNPMGTDYTAPFTTADVGVTPHENYSTASNLCGNCHVVHEPRGRSSSPRRRRKRSATPVMTAPDPRTT